MPAFEDLISKNLPQTRLNGCANIEERKGTIRMRKPVVRKFPELNGRRILAMYAEPRAPRFVRYWNCLFLESGPR